MPRTLIDRRTQLLGPSYRLFYDEPLHVVRADGVWLYGADGKAYLDCYNNVASLGHCRPEIVEAISLQSAILNTHTRYLNECLLDYAEALLSRLPPHLGHVVFTCSGSEANDLALRIAKAQTRGNGFVVTQNAYHGGTDAVAQLSPSLNPDLPNAPHVRFVAPPDSFREDGGSISEAFASRITAAFEDLRQCGFKPAAFLADSLFSSDGLFVEPVGSLKAAEAAVRAAGALFIADEVQSGFCRTGDTFWGFARHGVAPDIVTMGKPMGNGHPVAGLAVRPEALAEFGQLCRYFNTFGGNPVSAAAGLAVLEVIEREGILSRVRETGSYLGVGLKMLASRHALIGDVRGVGLFFGVELVRDGDPWQPAPEEASIIVNRMRAEGVLIGSTGRYGNVLKIRPPLVSTRDNTDLLLDVLTRSLESIG